MKKVTTIHTLAPAIQVDNFDFLHIKFITVTNQNVSDIEFVRGIPYCDGQPVKKITITYYY